jgi:hypothetical protein
MPGDERRARAANVSEVRGPGCGLGNDARLLPRAPSVR